MGDDFFMSDTLNSFAFPELEPSRESTNNKNQEDVSFDDSSFLKNVTFELENNNNSKLLNNCSKEVSNECPDKQESSFCTDSDSLIELINRNSISELLTDTKTDTNKSTIEGDHQNESRNNSLRTDDNSLCIFKDENIIQTEIYNSLNNLSLNGKESDWESDRIIIDNSQITTKVKNKKCINLDAVKDDTDATKYNLSAWGLPDSVLEKYKSKKIEKMFHWQYECLSNHKVLNKLSNLIYSAPTSAGKTLVAEILALKTIFERKKKVIFILPFISIVREKMYYFQDILNNSGIRVDGFMGSYSPPGDFTSIHFAICTIEKANNLINKLLEENRLSEIGSILVDEMHLLGDPHRGYILELLLTKLRYICLKDPSIQIQIIGMSATLPNLDQLAKWLGAELYSTSFRPIPLYEQLSICGEIYDQNFQLIRKLDTLPDIGVDTDNILQLCLETIKDSCSALIFCPTKNWCENLAQQLALAFFKIGSSKSPLGEVLRSEIKSNLIIEVLEQLKFCPVGLDSTLKKTVSFGISFHHAGLTMDERDIIEGAFRNGTLRVLIATSTLSSGVNLPARRVLIRSPNFCGRPLDILTYRQMIGRAGRMGKDTMGESILICQKKEINIGKDLMFSNLPIVTSCLETSGKLKRAILEVIASGVAESPNDVTLFTNCTLLAVINSNNSALSDTIEEAVIYLKKHEFIKLQKLDEMNTKYIATALGKACLSSSIPPDEGLTLFTELEKARQCFVLETELHLIYLVTPYSACYSWSNIDWMLYFDIWGKLPLAMKKVGQLVGVKESYIINNTRGKTESTDSKAYHKMLIHKRFFIALALQDLVNEVPLLDVCSKFGCNKGMLQSLQQSASTFAGMVTLFSRHLRWTSVEILLAQFQERMQFGVSRDLLDLMHLPSLNGKLARILYNSGIETIINLANCTIEAVENILCKARPFESTKQREGESKYITEQRNKLRTVWIAGKNGLTEKEAAEVLLKDARNYLELQMGLKEARWKTENDMDQIQKVGTPRVQSEKEKEFVVHIQTLQNNNNVQRSDLKIPNQIDQQLQNVEKKVSHNSVEPDKYNAEETIQGDKIVTAEGSSPKIESISETSEVALSMSEESLNERNSTVDSSFHLELSNSSIENLSTESVDVFSSQELFQEFLQNIDCESDINELCLTKKRLRSNSNSSKENSFLESTPEKKSKLTVEAKTPLSVTAKKSSRKCLQNIEQFVTTEFRNLCIIDVCNTETLRNTFMNELNCKTNFSFSLACTKRLKNTPLIGQNIFLQANKSSEYDENCIYKDKKVEGFAFCWGGTESYFLSLSNVPISSKVIKSLHNIFTDKERFVKIMDAKEQIKTLMKCCNLEFDCKIEDPKVGDWLLNPDGKEKSIQALINSYHKELGTLGNLVGKTNNAKNFGLNIDSTVDPKLRASVEAVVTWHLVDALKQKLYPHLPSPYKLHIRNFPAAYDLEMRTILCLTNIESNGLSVDKQFLQELIDLLKQQQHSIEKKAYSLAGKRFNLSSPTDISKALGTFNGKKCSTNKEALQQINHPIAELVLTWRKVNFTLTKVLYPLVRNCDNNRIYGLYDSYTATGRITMHEPNIQMIPKDFQIVDAIANQDVLISCRNAFSVSDGFLLLSADYCQLELRILTYLANDKLLIDSLKKPGDVFKSIAAKWNSISEDMVDDNMRHQCKQLCYGIIYGMGPATLAKQLSISEDEAFNFMESFRNAYSGIKTFIKRTLEFCRSNGYVETITGRRRYLPHITSNDAAMKGQAERQAVNTSIQGSAADIVKNAMITIEDKINLIFKKSRVKPRLTLHLHDELIFEVPVKHIKKTVKIVKKEMENSCSTLGYFPVKIRTGKSWGKLQEYCDNSF